MQSKRPSVLGQMANYRLELRFHCRRQVGPWLDEVFEVGGREREHLTGAVQPV